jgi:hypothetical protein
MVYSIFIPPFSARKRWPASLNSTISTLPAGPEGPSEAFFCTWVIEESGITET